MVAKVKIRFNALTGVISILTKANKLLKASYATYKLEKDGKEYICQHNCFSNLFRFKLHSNGTLEITNLPLLEHLQIKTAHNISFSGMLQIKQLIIKAKSVTNLGVLITDKAYLELINGLKNSKAAIFGVHDKAKIFSKNKGINNQGEFACVNLRANIAIFTNTKNATCSLVDVEFNTNINNSDQYKELATKFTNAGNLSFNTLNGYFLGINLTSTSNTYGSTKCFLRNYNDLTVSGKFVIAKELFYEGEGNIQINPAGFIVSKNRMILKCKGIAYLDGHLGAKAFFNLRPLGGVVSTHNSKIVTNGYIIIESKYGNLDNYGTICAGNSISLLGKAINNRGKNSLIAAAKISYLQAQSRLSNEGDILTNETAIIYSRLKITNEPGARILSNQLYIKTCKLNNKGFALPAANLLPTSNEITILDNVFLPVGKAKLNALIGAHTTFNCNSATVVNSGTLFSYGSINFRVANKINNLIGGYLLAQGYITINVHNNLLNTGAIITKDILTVLSNQGNNFGIIAAYAALLNFTSKFNNSNTIHVTDRLAIQAADTICLEQEGKLQAKGKIDLIAGVAINTKADILSSQSLSIITNNLTHKAGLHYAEKNIKLQLANWILRGKVHAKQNLITAITDKWEWQAAGEFSALHKMVFGLNQGYVFNQALITNSELEFISNRTASFTFNYPVQANKLQILTGELVVDKSAGLYGAEELKINTLGDINVGAYIASAGNAELETSQGSINNESTIDIGGNLAIKACGELHNLGMLRAGGDVSLQVSRILNEMLYSTTWSADRSSGKGIALSPPAIFDVAGSLSSYADFYSKGSALNVGQNCIFQKGGFQGTDYEIFEHWTSERIVKGKRRYKVCGPHNKSVKQEIHHITQTTHRAALNVGSSLIGKDNTANYILPHTNVAHDISLTFSSLLIPAPIDNQDKVIVFPQIINLNEYYREDALFQYNKEKKYVIDAIVDLKFNTKALPDKKVFLENCKAGNFRDKYCPALEARLLKEALTRVYVRENLSVNLNYEDLLGQLRQNALEKRSDQPKVMYTVEDYLGEPVIVPRLYIPQHTTQNGIMANNITLQGADNFHSRMEIKGRISARQNLDIEAWIVKIDKQTVTRYITYKVSRKHSQIVAVQKPQNNTGLIAADKICFAVGYLYGSGANIIAKKTLNINFAEVLQLRPHILSHRLPEYKEENFFRTKISGGIICSSINNYLTAKEIILNSLLGTAYLQNTQLNAEKIGGNLALNRLIQETLLTKNHFYCHRKFKIVGKLAVLLIYYGSKALTQALTRKAANNTFNKHPAIKDLPECAPSQNLISTQVENIPYRKINFQLNSDNSLLIKYDIFKIPLWNYNKVAVTPRWQLGSGVDIGFTTFIKSEGDLRLNLSYNLLSGAKELNFGLGGSVYAGINILNIEKHGPSYKYISRTHINVLNSTASFLLSAKLETDGNWRLATKIQGKAGINLSVISAGTQFKSEEHCLLGNNICFSVEINSAVEVLTIGAHAEGGMIVHANTGAKSIYFNMQAGMGLIGHKLGGQINYHPTRTVRFSEQRVASPLNLEAVFDCAPELLLQPNEVDDASHLSKVHIVPKM